MEFEMKSEEFIFPMAIGVALVIFCDGLTILKILSVTLLASLPIIVAVGILRFRGELREAWREWRKGPDQ